MPVMEISVVRVAVRYAGVVAHHYSKTGVYPPG
jgi:hypothetical protein